MTRCGGACGPLSAEGELRAFLASAGDTEQRRRLLPSLAAIERPLYCPEIGRWYVTSALLVAQLLRDPRAGNDLARAHPGTSSQVLHERLAPRAPSILFTDPPLHNTLRAALADALGPRRCCRCQRRAAASRPCESFAGPTLAGRFPANMASTQSKRGSSSPSQSGSIKPCWRTFEAGSSPRRHRPGPRACPGPGRPSPAPGTS